MPNSKNKRLLSNHVWVVYLLLFIIIFIMMSYQWKIATTFAILAIASLIYALLWEKRRHQETEQYISTLSLRIGNVGKEVLNEIPIGILLYNDDMEVVWSNPYMNQFENESTLIGRSLLSLSEDLDTSIRENKQTCQIQLKDTVFHVTVVQEEKLLFLFDRTSETELEHLYERSQPFIAIIYLDNYEEITQNMEDTSKSHLNSSITSVLSEWAQSYGLYLKRTSQDRFLAIGTNEIIANLEKKKFDILDVVREFSSDHEHKNPITLSIGVGIGNTSLPELGKIAQSSLDLALGRGGDQVVIRDVEGKVRFYGGKTNPMEKRTRVRARVISHALADLIKESDQVFIMGHRNPDMDVLGSAIGLLKMAITNEKKGFIVFDPEDVHSGIQRLVEALHEDEKIRENFIDPEEAELSITNKSLVIVVDTHKPSMVPNPKLLDLTDYKVVIDHHRRGEEFVEQPTLVYMEPYASSTSELVTELLEYQPLKVNLNTIEATALLAGIIVDTKNFTLRTGSRTFDAASYLRSNGADTILVQRLMKEDLNVYMKRNRLIERTKIYFKDIAIVTAPEHERYDQVLIAQTADTLLMMSGIQASFVICKRQDGQVGISARSLGDINVQVIMESMNGGGHLTNAATQIKDATVEEVKEQLIEILNEYFQGSEET